MPEPKQGPASAAPAAAAPEPLAAILAEMRKAVVPMICGRPKIEAVSIRDVLQWADRIEAAAEREYEEAKAYFEKLHDGPSMICTAKNCAVRNVGLAIANAAPGNAAAMRAALQEIVLLNLKVGKSIHGDVACGIMASKARRALSAPARNCDRVATYEEAVNAYRAWTEQNTGNVSNVSGRGMLGWLFAPAEGGAE